MATTASAIARREDGKTATEQVESVPDSGDDETGDGHGGAASDGDEATPSSDDREPTAREPDEARRRPRLTAVLTAFVVLAIAALVAGCVLYADHRDNAAAVNRDRDVLSVSRSVSEYLVTLRYKTAAADMKRLAGSTTGDFQKQFTEAGDSFRAILNQGQVESVGKAREVALVDSSDSKATVLSAVVSTVKNTEVPGGQPRVYRMKLSLEKHDGQWLVSNVEFVA